MAENDYYEVISDDETIGTYGDEHVETQSVGVKHIVEKEELPFDFEDLPFVPKFSSEIRNTVESVKNNENDSIISPLVGDWGCDLNSRLPVSPSRSAPQLNCPYFPDQSIPVASDKPKNETNQIQSTSLTVNSEPYSSELKPNPLLGLTDFSSRLDPSLNSLIPPITSETYDKACLLSTKKIDHESPAEKNKSFDASWVDENGDPITGAFDSIDANSVSESCVNMVNNTKVEYVFHVKEKKSEIVPKSDSCLGSVSEVIPNGTVSSLAYLASNSNLTPEIQTFSSSVNLQDSVNCEISEDYDQKKLYEASRNKHELGKIIPDNENNPSTSGSGDKKDYMFKKKAEHFVFKRNNFMIQKNMQEASGSTEPNQSEPKALNASVEEKALESQALNELLREVKLGAERAKSYGALGWQKQAVPVVNKTFLKNTLVSTLRKPYKPPSRRGCRHEGLRKDKDDSTDSSSSSSSRSRSSSGSTSSYSSSSRSRDSRSRSRERKHKRLEKRHGAPPPGWPGGPPPNAFYDWAAMGQYASYPWYDPEALSMYYGMDGYPQMCYNDPEYWAAYCDFYGIGGYNNPGFRGGSRGRGRGWHGRGGRGRGRGNDDVEFGDNRKEHPRYSDSGSFSQSRSRSFSPTSKDRRKRHLENRSRSPDSPSEKGRSLESAKNSTHKREGSQNRADSRGSSKVGVSKSKSGDDGEKSKGKKKKTGFKSASQASGKEGSDEGKKDVKKKKKKRIKLKKDDGSGKNSTPANTDEGEKDKQDVSKVEKDLTHNKKAAKRKLKKCDDGENEGEIKKKKKKLKTGGKKSHDDEKLKKDGSGKKKKAGGKLKKVASSSLEEAQNKGDELSTSDSKKEKNSGHIEHNEENRTEEEGSRKEKDCGLVENETGRNEQNRVGDVSSVSRRNSQQKYDEPVKSASVQELVKEGVDVLKRGEDGKDRKRENDKGAGKNGDSVHVREKSKTVSKESKSHGRNINGPTHKRLKDKSDGLKKHVSKHEEGAKLREGSKERKEYCLDEERSKHKREHPDKMGSSSDFRYREGLGQQKSEYFTNSGSKDDGEKRKMNKIEEIERRLKERKEKRRLEEIASKEKENPRDEGANRKEALEDKEYQSQMRKDLESSEKGTTKAGRGTSDSVKAVKGKKSEQEIDVTNDKKKDKGGKKKKIKTKLKNNGKKKKTSSKSLGKKDFLGENEGVLVKEREEARCGTEISKAAESFSSKKGPRIEGQLNLEKDNSQKDLSTEGKDNPLEESTGKDGSGRNEESVDG